MALAVVRFKGKVVEIHLKLTAPESIHYICNERFNISELTVKN